ncbi:hypothetical protein [Streptomyces sp. NPDC055793]
MINRSGRAASFALAAGLARTGLTALRAVAPGGRERWERVNHAGRTVDLYAGPACALAAAVGTARVRPAAGLAVLAAGVCGAYDDVAGAGDARRGFRAHLTALRDGEVTGGAVKLFGVCGAALAAGAVLKERPLDRLPAGVVAERTTLGDTGAHELGAALGVVAAAVGGELAAGPRRSLV